MGESLLSGPSGNVPPEMIKMHTHTTLITHTQLFSALIVNWEEEKIKRRRRRRRVSTDITHGGVLSSPTESEWKEKKKKEKRKKE